jgi:predicted nucleotidyltransferase
MSSTGEIASLPNIELQRVRTGIEETALSNEHQPTPIGIEFVLHSLNTPEIAGSPKKFLTIAWKINHLGTNACESERILKFLQILTGGGIMRLSSTTDNALQQTFELPEQIEHAPPLEFIELVNELCFIQQKTKQFFRIPKEGISPSDIRAIKELTAIVRRGKIVKHARDFMLDAKGDGLQVILDVHRLGQPCHFTVVYEESEVEILETIISVGPMTQHITGWLDMPVEELESIVSTLPADSFVSLKFVDLEVIEIFPDWFIREAKRLSKLLADKFDIRSVYLFGSLANKDSFNPNTDIDLAVTHLPGEQYLKAIGFIEKETDFPANLVELGSAPDYLRETILKEGKLLFERESLATVGG